MYKLHETEKPLALEAKQAAVTVSKIGLDWLGKIITHKNAGQRSMISDGVNVMPKRNIKTPL